MNFKPNKLKTVLVIIFILILSFLGCKKKETAIISKVYFLKTLQNWGVVNPAYTTYIETNLNNIRKQKNVKAVIIEIDTPGGSIRDAEKIVKLIKECPFPTITYISNAAYSAGAMLSLAGNYTVMSPHSKVGAMEPVMIDPSTKQMRTAPEKIVSAMRANMRGLAEARIKRLLKEHKEGKRQFKNIEWIKNLPDTAEAMVDKTKVLTLKKHGIKLDKKSLLTITTDQCLKIGFADYTVKNIKDILKKFNLSNSKLVRITPTIKHVFISFLTNSWMSMILIGLGILGLVIELKTPGWGIPGTFGILALALFFYSQIVAGNASWEAPVLFIIGLILLGVEIFVIPGFGVVGIAGILCIFASFYTGLGVKFHNFAATKHLISKASMIIFGAIASSVTLSILLIKFIPKTRLFPKIVLTDAELGFKSHEDMSILTGKTGITISPLRPSGIAIIEDKRVDVVSQGEFIDKDKTIIVVEVDGSRIIVTDKK